MKTTSLLTASALLSYASAEVHKLKLNKVPLSEQLVSDVLPNLFHPGQISGIGTVWSTVG